MLRDSNTSIRFSSRYQIRLGAAGLLYAVVATLLLLSPMPVVVASVNDLEQATTRSTSTSSKQQKARNLAEVRELVSEMVEMLANDAPDHELERVGRRINELVWSYDGSIQAEDSPLVRPFTYFQELLKASAKHPEERAWLIAARAQYKSPKIFKGGLLNGALSLFDPHVDGGESLIAYQVLVYLAGGYDALKSWDEEGALPDWDVFVEYLDAHWRPGRFEDSEQEVVALVYFLMRIDAQRALELFVAPNGMLPPEVIGEEGRAARQRIATLLREVDTMLWKQRHQFIDDEEATPEGREAIAALAESEHWWVRLAALHLMFNEPELFQMDVYQELTRDPQERIRKETEVLKMLVRKEGPLVHENLRPLRREQSEMPLDVRE